MGLNVGISVSVIYLIEKRDAKKTYNFFPCKLSAVEKG